MIAHRGKFLFARPITYFNSLQSSNKSSRICNSSERPWQLKKEDHERLCTTDNQRKPQLKPHYLYSGPSGPMNGNTFPNQNQFSFQPTVHGAHRHQTPLINYPHLHRQFQYRLPTNSVIYYHRSRSPEDSERMDQSPSFWSTQKCSNAWLWCFSVNFQLYKKCFSCLKVVIQADMRLNTKRQLTKKLTWRLTPFCNKHVCSLLIRTSIVSS